MFLKPITAAKENSAEFERTPFIKPTGFREYDARWVFGKEINLLGITAIGVAIGQLFEERGVKKRIVVGHDYRWYSASIKNALINGLLASGMEVHDIGLCLSPTAYFAQFELDIEGVAMVTASHNDNGWTGIKMGLDKPLTFGPDEMSRLKEITYDGTAPMNGGGQYHYHAGFETRYKDDLTNRKPFERKIRAVVACGNGTAGAFAPDVLSKLGIEVIPLHTELDHSFPNHNPNPEDMKMLTAIQDAVSKHKADLGLAFDGDGDRCGVIDNEGNTIFADKVGVMLARDISALHENALFVADVKSTGLFLTDPVLQKNGATTHFWKTGHSYIKRYSHENGAIVGFEKSGHFFFNPPLGRGYDDGLVAAMAVLDMLDRNPEKTIADLKNELPTTYQSPSMSPHCDDEEKYDVVDRIVDHFTKHSEQGGQLAGQSIRELITVNGIRIVLEDGTWGLVRASSNKPELVVVVESPTTEANMRAIFKELDDHLATYPEIGAYNQKI